MKSSYQLLDNSLVIQTPHMPITKKPTVSHVQQMFITTNPTVKCKVHPITGHQGPRGRLEVSLYSFSTLVLEGVVSIIPWLLYPQEGFNPRTVQPVVSRCTD
jgi:hypothetical protein